MEHYNFEELDNLLYGDPCDGENDDNIYLIKVTPVNKITLCVLPATSYCISTTIYLHDKCNQFINNYEEYKQSYVESTDYCIIRKYKYSDKIIFVTLKKYNRSSKLIKTIPFIDINKYIIAFDNKEKVDLLIEYALRKVSTKRTRKRNV